MNTELLEKYSVIRRQLASLKDEEALLKKAIMQEMGEVKSFASPFGKFSIATKTNWEYTSKVQTLEEKVKLAKIDEQESGRAKAKFTTYLTYKK
jgi:hypothetical protein